jgi:hypothetical protein
MRKVSVFIGYYGDIRLYKSMTIAEAKIQQYYIDTYNKFIDRIANEREVISPHLTNADCSQRLNHKSHDD